MHIYHDYWAALLGLNNLHDYINASISKLKEQKYWSQLSTLIKNDPARYYIGKKISHSSNYGTGPLTLQLAILKDTEGKTVLSVKEVKEFLGMYFSLFPEIRNWHAEIQDQLRTCRMLKNLFGFPRKFHQPFGEELWKQGYAFISQSTVGVLTSIAITSLQNRLDNK